MTGLVPVWSCPRNPWAFLCTEKREMSVKTINAALKYGNAASPEVFTAVASVTDFSGPSGQRQVIDITRLASTGKEKNVGLPDYGQITFNLIWDSDNTYDVSVWDKFVAGTQHNWQVVFDNSPQDVISFAGYVLAFNFTSNLDDVVRASCTIEIDGAVTDNF
jgi:predicted secreted protein